MHGWASFSDGKTCTVETKDGPVMITAENVILANGSLPVELKSLPSAATSSPRPKRWRSTPCRKSWVVVGGGYIGLELGIAFRKLGADVTIVEAQDRILPIYDAPLVEPVKKWLERNGVKLHLGAQGQRCRGRCARDRNQRRQKEKLPADKILVTIGASRAPTAGVLENMAIDRDGAFVKVDNECRTSMKGVYAIGDLVGEPMLAHKASAQGEMVAEIIAGRRRKFEPVAIPAICFTEPKW